MYDDIRNVTLTGGCTKDSELKYSATGTPILSINMGCSESRKNKQTQQYDQINHYFEVTFFGKYSETLVNHIKRGTKLSVSGELVFQNWQDNNGNNRSKVCIKAEKVKILSSNTQGNNQQSSSQGYGDYNNNQGFQGDDPNIPF